MFCWDALSGYELSSQAAEIALASSFARLDSVPTSVWGAARVLIVSERDARGECYRAENGWVLGVVRILSLRLRKLIV